MSLQRLPNELLMLIAKKLDSNCLACWIRTSRFFYDRLVHHLYCLDIQTGRRVNRYFSVHWACARPNMQTLRRAFTAGADPNRGPDGLRKIAVQFSSGEVRRLKMPADASEGHAWHFINVVLTNALASRWCPLPFIQCLLENGGRLETSAPTDEPNWNGVTGYDATKPWGTVMMLRNVTPALARKRMARPMSSPDARECLHKEPCSLAVTKLLLQGGASTTLNNFTGDDLATLAIMRSDAPIEILACLSEAGMDLSAPERPWFVFAAGSDYDEAMHQRIKWYRTQTPLEVALKEAFAVRDHMRLPRDLRADKEDEIVCKRAPEIVAFLLEEGVHTSPFVRHTIDCLNQGLPRPMH